MVSLVILSCPVHYISIGPALNWQLTKTLRYWHYKLLIVLLLVPTDVLSFKQQNLEIVCPTLVHYVYQVIKVSFPPWPFPSWYWWNISDKQLIAKSGGFLGHLGQNWNDFRNLLKFSFHFPWLQVWRKRASMMKTLLPDLRTLKSEQNFLRSFKKHTSLLKK